MSTIKIHRSVGANAMNDKADVAMIQFVLNHFIGKMLLSGYKKLAVDGGCGPKTRETITAFQIQNFLVSEEHFNGQIWPCGATISFMNKKAGDIFGLPGLPGLPECPDQPKLVDMLWQVQTEKLTGDSIRRKHLARLRRFFIRGFEGEAIDHSYWSYTYFSTLGQEYSPWQSHSIESVKRLGKQPAFNNFINKCSGATSVDVVGNALSGVEGAVAAHTLLLVRWFKQAAGVSEGQREWTEMSYLKDMALLAIRSRPESIYWVYADELLSTHKSLMRPFLTADAIWQLRQPGRQ